jgi:phage terminase large subunit-like protein
MKRGPKPAVAAGPIDLSKLPKSGSRRVIAFIETYLVIPRGVGALEPVKLRPWQKRIIRAIYDNPRPWAVLVSISRGNGKTALCAMLSVYELIATGEEGPRVYAVASDERQAARIMDYARRLIQLSPRLEEIVTIYRDRLVVEHTDGEMRAMPSESAALEGLEGSFIVDELHVVSTEVWETVVGSAGKRPGSRIVAISTPASSREGIMWRLVEHGREGTDPDFRLIEYAAPAGCDLDDRRAWKKANPALGDFLEEAALRANLKTLRPAAFRRYRLGQWAGDDAGWMSWDTWMDCATGETIADDATVVLGFDGSASGDSTALVAATVDDVPHVQLLGIWENPGDPRWRVPRAEVIGAIEAAFERFDVLELAADPWGWRSELETLATHYPGRILQWPTNLVGRMAPATDRLYAAVTTGRLTHAGDRRLAEHITNAIAKSTPAGDVIVKDARHGRRRKIDAAIAAIVAVDRAAHYTQTPRRIGVIAL